MSLFRSPTTRMGTPIYEKHLKGCSCVKCRAERSFHHTSRVDRMRKRERLDYIAAQMRGKYGRKKRETA